MKEAGIKVVAGTVDTVEETAALAEGLRIGFVEMFGGLDVHAASEATGAFIQEGDRTFLHATGFLVNPEGQVDNAVYSSGPIGRLTASDVLKKVHFAKKMRAKAN